MQIDTLSNCDLNSFLVIIRIIHEEKLGVCDHEVTHECTICCDYIWDEMYKVPCMKYLCT